MATAYSEVPDNYDILKPFLLTEFSDYKTIIDNADIVVFYDTCAIQHHANLDLINQQRLIDYLTNKKTVILITKCVLMELGGDNHLIHKNVIRYFKFLIEKGVKIILFEESMVYCFLSEVYQSASKINEILRYAVREFSIPTSIIRETVRNDPKLTALIGDNNISSNSDLCEYLFASVRSGKQHEDNLGEQLIGICIYLLLHLPAEPTNKFSIYTDDRGAARIIYKAVKSIPKDVSDKRAGIFSSLKIFQDMYEDCYFSNEDELKDAIKAIYPQKIRTLALMEKSDLNANEYEFTAEELAHLISQKKTIKITF